MTTPTPIVELKDVRFRWPGRASFSVSVPEFHLETGQSTLLLGESGSGKSTLLSLICGAITADAGQIIVDGAHLMQMPAAARDRFRAETIGIVFQQFNLLPFGTVSENIRLPLHFAPKRKQRVGDVNAAIKQLCAALNLPDDILTARASTLSVGQQQRTAVARALIGAPPLVIADEPTSALDEATRSAFLDLLFTQVSAQGQTLLMVSHDPRLADRFDRVIEIFDVLSAERSVA